MVNMFENVSLGTNFKRMRKNHIKAILEELKEYEEETRLQGKTPSLEDYKTKLNNELNSL